MEIKQISINKKQLEEFRNCEQGAAEDEITGPSPLTTLEILNRHNDHIEMQTIEEAAQIADCCQYGTFPLHYPKTANKIWLELMNDKQVCEIWDKYNKNEYAALINLINNQY